MYYTQSTFAKEVDCCDVRIDNGGGYSGRGGGENMEKAAKRELEIRDLGARQYTVDAWLPSYLCIYEPHTMSTDCEHPLTVGS